MKEHKRIELVMLFVKLAEDLSYTKAAASLGISKGHLSEQIKKLEQHLKAPLLQRTTRNVKLTQYGTQVFTEGKHLRTKLFDIERSISSEKIEGKLRLTAPRMFAQTFLIDICTQFKSQYPDIQFEIDASYHTHDLNERDFDLGFRATVKPPEDMIAAKLFSYDHPVVAAPHYLSTHPSIVVPTDVSEHQCLTMNANSVWQFDEQKVPVTGWLSSNDNTLLKYHALKGHGLIKVASYFIQQELQTGALQQVLQQFTAQPKNHIYLFYPQLVYPAPKTKAFIAFVKHYFESPVRN
ncbi:LysR family transcriptional regulator [Pseudoalteromonas luteoviolacea]|uniref:LysR family transcriptional regulator n=1 Tax=Pseudoalteromonas luteoviolacea TaxID=43657 RepID=UPI00114FE660|nr:LysR family transcriptional regulator [Pseudoalteromonas luteoviolacea]TQF70437.1 LysR family transcriptional regulator [Pseudoalteromonas luteoviolacea]